MSLLSTQRDQIKRIVLEIESLRSELRADPDEFGREMRALAAWCLWQSRDLAKRSAA